MSGAGEGTFCLAAAVVAALSVLAGCSRSLPEEGSPAAALYRARCGTCHRAVSPKAVKYGTWRMILPRMEWLMSTVGQPLSPHERVVIEAYLERNSG